MTKGEKKSLFQRTVSFLGRRGVPARLQGAQEGPGEGEGGANGESSIESYTLPYVKLDSGNLLYNAGSSNSVLSDKLEGWDLVGGGREAPGGRNICVPMAASY